MTSALSPAKIDANRANAQLSTGPVTAGGKAASSRNAVSHGLTSRIPVLPGESEEEFTRHVADYVARFAHNPETAAELAGLNWRLKRIPGFEAQIIQLEVDRILNDPELQEFASQLPLQTVAALAFTRLIERKVLTNLYSLENRMQRRADKLMRQLLDQPESSGQTRQQHPIQENVQNEPTIARAAAADPPAKQPQPAQHKPAASHKVGRNEPCPCGSNLKFKRCCGNPVSAPPQTAATAAA
jgi:hypothetical protein